MRNSNNEHMPINNHQLILPDQDNESAGRLDASRFRQLEGAYSSNVKENGHVKRV